MRKNMFVTDLDLVKRYFMPNYVQIKRSHTPGVDYTYLSEIIALFPNCMYLLSTHHLLPHFSIFSPQTVLKTTSSNERKSTIGIRNNDSPNMY